MRRRSTIAWILVGTLAGALAGAMAGTAITSHRLQLLRAEVARLEQSRARLQQNSDAMAAALREARAPLARRIHELEATLAAREAAPHSEEQAEALAVVAAAEPAPAAPPPRVEEPVPPEPTASREPPAPRATAPPQDVEDPAAKRVATSSPPRDESPAPPAVSAPPPAADSPCRSLALPDFALDSPDAEVGLFEGRLVLGIDASGPGLVMRLGDGTRHSLIGLPLHVATQCEGLPYIVSICLAERDPFEVRGVISPADAWHKPCRALLQQRGEAQP